MKKLESQAKKEKTEKKEKKDSSEKKPKISKLELFKNMAACLNSELSGLPEFPQRFYLTDITDGKIRIIREVEPDTKVVYDTDEDEVFRAVQAFVSSSKMRGFSDYAWLPNDCLQFAKYWRAVGRNIGKVKPVAELSEDNFCYYRLPFDLEHDLTKTPLFDEMMSRTTNAKALCEFIGSLFYEESYRQQYVWIYGEGQNGKSSLARLLAKAFGRGYATENAPQGDPKFWTSGLLGKSIVVFPDCNSPSFVQSALFKQLTGEDSIRIEEKGKHPYSTKLSCKFIFISNELPTLSSQVSSVRRNILCEMKPITKEPDPEYDDKLWQEAKYILGNCKAMYDTLTKGRRVAIEPERDVMQAVIEESEQQYQYILDKYFVRAGEDESVTASRIQEIFRKEKITNPREQKKYFAYFLRQPGITRNPNNNVRGFRGLRLKTHFEMTQWENYTSDKIPAEMLAQERWSEEARLKNLEKHVEYVNETSEEDYQAKIERITQPDGSFCLDDL